MISFVIVCLADWRKQNMILSHDKHHLPSGIIMLYYASREYRNFSDGQFLQDKDGRISKQPPGDTTSKMSIFLLEIKEPSWTWGKRDWVWAAYVSYDLWLLHRARSDASPQRALFLHSIVDWITIIRIFIIDKFGQMSIRVVLFKMLS